MDGGTGTMVVSVVVSGVRTPVLHRKILLWVFDGVLDGVLLNNGARSFVGLCFKVTENPHTRLSYYT